MEERTMNDGVWELFNDVLKSETQASRENAKKLAQSSLPIIGLNSSALHTDAKINNVEQPILAVRTKAKECKLTARIGDEFCSGDLVEVFSEKWLILETYRDECDILYGKAILCNHLFRFQIGNNPTIIERYGVIDDGSYLSDSNKQIPLETGYYRIYLPLDDYTSKIHIGKRFAIGTNYDKKGNEILSVIKVSWIDKKSYNIGQGSHLLVLRAEQDQYDRNRDNLSLSICDFIESDTPEAPEEPEIPDDPETPEEPTIATRCYIVGKDEIRLGTSRDYEIVVKDDDGNQIDLTGKTFEWQYNEIAGITYLVSDDTTRLTISVPMTASLSGEVITIVVTDAAHGFVVGTKDVEVV